MEFLEISTQVEILYAPCLTAPVEAYRRRPSYQSAPRCRQVSITTTLFK
jgi:hypothetical protein